ncbi:hypothetical protein KM043_005593 [Ampulex compressa]|nr:hypothetical protein KM043_005593 [Ampulex compressa]
MHQRSRLSILVLLIILQQPLISDSHGAPVSDASRRSKIEGGFNVADNQRIDLHEQKGKSYFKGAENRAVRKYPPNKILQTSTSVRDAGIEKLGTKVDCGSSNLPVKVRAKESRDGGDNVETMRFDDEIGKDELEQGSKDNSNASRRTKREVASDPGVAKLVETSKSNEKSEASRENDASAGSMRATENRGKANIEERNDYNDVSMQELDNRLDYAEEIEEEPLNDRENGESTFAKGSHRISRGVAREVEEETVDRPKNKDTRFMKRGLDAFEGRDVKEEPLKYSNNKESEFEDSLHDSRVIKRNNQERSLDNPILRKRKSEPQNPRVQIKSKALEFLEEPSSDSNDKKTAIEEANDPRSVSQEIQKESLKDPNDKETGFQKENRRVRRSVPQEIPEEPLKDSNNEEEASLAKENLRSPRTAAEEAEKYTDQEERSNLYDEFEPKDVVKRGILDGAGDYEEVDEEEDTLGDVEDTVALEQGDSTIEEAEKTENRETRVKRDHSGAEDQKEIVEAKNGGSSNTGNEAKQQRLSKRNAPLEKRNSMNEEKSRSNVESSKIKKKREDDKTKADSLKSQGNKLEVHLSEEKGTVVEAPNPSDSSNVEEPSAASVSSHEASKLDDSSNLAKTSKDELKEAPKVEDSKVSENDVSKGTKKVDWGADYEKRVEEEIQRKIDSIKEEIKRDIESKQRVKEIEENNARFDELREQEDDDEDRQSLIGEEKEERRSVSKRSTGSSDIDAQGSKDKRSTIRKKRQNKGEEEKSAVKPVKKREYVRQVILVNDRGAEKEKRSERRRKRSRNSRSTPVKLTGTKTSGLGSDSNLRDSQSGNKALSSSSVSLEGEKVAHGRRTESLASLAADGQGLNADLAANYKEAFGGLQSEPVGALARFKRIKRVLRAPKSRT